MTTPTSDVKLTIFINVDEDGTVSYGTTQQIATSDAILMLEIAKARMIGTYIGQLEVDKRKKEALKPVIVQPTIAHP